MNTKQRRDQRERITKRDGPMCRIQGPRCTGFGTQLDHIEERGMGGRKGAAKEWNDRDENMRWVCVTDHLERHSGGRVYVA